MGSILLQQWLEGGGKTEAVAGGWEPGLQALTEELAATVEQVKRLEAGGGGGGEDGVAKRLLGRMDKLEDQVGRMASSLLVEGLMSRVEALEAGLGAAGGAHGTQREEEHQETVHVEMDGEQG